MSAVESVYNFHLIKVDDYADSSQYLEAFEKRYDIVSRSGWSVASPEMRDMYIKELENKRMTNHPSYQKLLEWRKQSVLILAGGVYNATKVTHGIDVINNKYKAYG
jgi:hypothetical protein